MVTPVNNTAACEMETTVPLAPPSMIVEPGPAPLIETEIFSPFFEFFPMRMFSTYAPATMSIESPECACFNAAAMVLKQFLPPLGLTHMLRAGRASAKDGHPAMATTATRQAVNLASVTRFLMRHNHIAESSR